jgi:hypothetical protein
MGILAFNCGDQLSLVAWNIERDDLTTQRRAIRKPFIGYLFHTIPNYKITPSLLNSKSNAHISMHPAKK